MLNAIGADTVDPTIIRHAARTEPLPDDDETRTRHLEFGETAAMLSGPVAANFVLTTAALTGQACR